MKERIKAVATRMLIAHGSAGLRFQQIADELDCTRGNIHYYYRHKHQLIEAVTIEYCARTVERFKSIWLSDTDLSEKIAESASFNRSRYIQFNPTGRSSHPWSLIARMRLERDEITEAAREAVNTYTHELQKCVFAGMRQAVQRGELHQQTPIETVSLLLIELANSADPITRDAGNFERLQQMYQAFERLLKDAYGTAAASSA